MGSNSPLKEGTTAGLPSSAWGKLPEKHCWTSQQWHPNSQSQLFQWAAKLGLACAVCAVAMAIGGGCGRGKLERAVVSGRVTYQGRPVAKGQIRFVPTKGTQTPMWGAFIRDGKYEASGKGGVPVGTHRVEIVAYRTNKVEREASPPSDMMSDMPPPTRQYIPEKYNAKTKLEITIPPGSGKVVENFDL